MKLYITFSGEQFHDTTHKILCTEGGFGVDKVLVYDDWWLTHKRPAYCEQNKYLFNLNSDAPAPYPKDKPRAINYFAWKPLIILDALDRCQPGDVVLYTDADTYPVASLQPLYDIASRDGIMLFKGVTHNNKYWTKRECFAVMGQDEPKYIDAQAGCARFCLFQKARLGTNHLPTQLLWEWFTYCQNPLANTHTQTNRLKLPEYPEYRDHRNEQSILTNLALKYGFKQWRDPDQVGESHSEDKDVYGTVFNQYDHWTHGLTYGRVRGQGSMFRNVED